MNKFKIALFAVLAMFVFTGCSVTKSADSVIKINDTVITRGEFDKAFDAIASNGMFAQMGIDVKKDPDNTFALMMREKVVSELVVKALLNDEMTKNKITVSKEELENAEKEIVGKFGTKEQFQQLLKTNGVTYDAFKKDLEDEIKMKKYVDSIAMVSIGESEAKKYYDENPDKFNYPQRVRASHILIASNPEQIKAKLKEKDKNISDEDLNKKTEEMMKDNKAKAEKICADVKKAPGSFSKIAQTASQDPVSALKGGDLGFFAKDEMVDAFAEKAFSMKPGSISDVVTTQYGFHIIKVTDRNEAGTMPFEECKQDIINYLESQDKVEILKNKIESLRKSAKIEYFDNNYNPEEIQKKIKASYEKNPEANQDFAGENKEQAESK